MILCFWKNLPKVANGCAKDFFRHVQYCQFKILGNNNFSNGNKDTSKATPISNKASLVSAILLIISFSFLLEFSQCNFTQKAISNLRKTALNMPKAIYTQSSFYTENTFPRLPCKNETIWTQIKIIQKTKKKNTTHIFFQIKKPFLNQNNTQVFTTALIP